MLLLHLCKQLINNWQKNFNLWSCIIGKNCCSEKIGIFFYEEFWENLTCWSTLLWPLLWLLDRWISRLLLNVVDLRQVHQTNLKAGSPVVMEMNKYSCHAGLIGRVKPSHAWKRAAKRRCGGGDAKIWVTLCLIDQRQTPIDISTSPTLMQSHSVFMLSAHTSACAIALSVRFQTRVLERNSWRREGREMKILCVEAVINVWATQGSHCTTDMLSTHVLIIIRPRWTTKPLCVHVSVFHIVFEWTEF